MRTAVALLTAILCTGCASFVRHDPASASLETYIGKIRTLSAAAKPHTGNGSLAPTIETTDGRLAAALRDLDVEPTAEHHRRVAAEYSRLHVLDHAYAHLARAVALEPRGAANYDGLARIWRDWGFANLGLADAYRAVDLAPRSPVAANTLGTLLAATGQTSAARDWYARALALDARATYALTNLCYVEFLAGRASARPTCERAAAPGLPDARHNLALVHAADGDFDGARELLARGAGAAGEADYNMGVVFMAAGQYRKAAAAFASARRTQPTFRLAAERERQAVAAAIHQETTNAQP